MPAGEDVACALGHDIRRRDNTAGLDLPGLGLGLTAHGVKGDGVFRHGFRAGIAGQIGQIRTVGFIDGQLVHDVGDDIVITDDHQRAVLCQNPGRVHHRQQHRDGERNGPKTLQLHGQCPPLIPKSRHNRGFI